MSSVPDRGPAGNTPADANATVLQPEPAARERVGCQDDGAPQVIVSCANADWHFSDIELLDEAQTRLLADLIVAEQIPTVDLQRVFHLAPAGQLRAIDCIREIELRRGQAIQARNAALLDVRTRSIQMMSSENSPENGDVADAGTPVTEQLVRYISDEHTTHNNGFAALLDALPAGLGAETIFAARGTLLRAADIWHSSNLELAHQLIQERFQARRYPRPRLNTLRQEAASARQQAAPVEEDGSRQRVIDAIPGAPVAEGVVVPDGWLLTATGVMEDGRGPMLMHAPLVISERLQNPDDGTEVLVLAHLRDGRWQSRIVDRGDAADSRAIIKYADFGFPFNSNNAAHAVEYLAAFEAANSETLPVAIVARQCGWKGMEQTPGFLFGTEFIPGEPLNAGDPPAPVVRFHGGDRGDQQLAEGFATRGNMQGWLRTVGPLRRYPRVMLAIYTALATMLLRIFDAHNFALDFNGQTSMGKTTTLRVGASAYGSPDEGATPSAISTWAATPVWIERAAAILHGLPLILDDTKRVRDPKIIAPIVYAISNGRGVGRGTREGLAWTTSCSTILISSGEAAITSFSGDGGTRGRTLLLRGSPFERQDSETATIISALNVGIHEHHGHAGRAFVRFLMAERQRWPEFENRFRDRQRYYVERAAGDPVAARLAEHIALIDVAEWLVHEAIAFGWACENVVERLYPALIAGAPEADRASAALAHVMSWAAAHESEFWRPDRSGFPPSPGWAGRWDRGENRRLISFLPHKLNEILRAGDFEPDPVLFEWHAREWLTTNPGKRLHRRRLAEQNPHMVTINRAAADTVVEHAAGPVDEGRAEAADPRACRDVFSPPPLPIHPARSVPAVPAVGNSEGTA